MSFDQIASYAWAIYREFKDEEYVVKPSMPILYFGDYRGYEKSRLKIVTVGLNPSHVEFPSGQPFERFIDAESHFEDFKKYQQSLNEYFLRSPYRKWFDLSFSSLLKGLDASFYSDALNHAIHTDLCFPLATNPTWSKLRKNQKSTLEESGVALWHQLIEYLQPDIVLISVAKTHLDKIKFEKVEPWHSVYHIERKNPYHVEKCTLRLTSGKTTEIYWGKAANTPFGTVSKKDKEKLGQFIKGGNVYA